MQLELNRKDGKEDGAVVSCAVRNSHGDIVCRGTPLGASWELDFCRPLSAADVAAVLELLK